MTPITDLLGDPIKADKARKARVMPPRPARDPFVITDRTAVSISGGRTSGYMLHRILEANGGLPDCCELMFANTGLEHEATLEFVAEMSYRWKVPIHWVEYTAEAPGFREVTFDTASRDGEPYEALILKRRYLPNPTARFCTVELKILTIERACLAMGWDDWDAAIGIRADEPARVARIMADPFGGRGRGERFLPLAVSGVTKQEVSGFWKRQPFDLRLPNEGGTTRHGNCVLCFLKPGAQVLSLVEEEPSRAVWYMRQEDRALTLAQDADQPMLDGHRFRNDRPSYAQMHAFALAQTDLFRDKSAEVISADLIERLRQDTGPGVDCFCGNDDA